MNARDDDVNEMSPFTRPDVQTGPVSEPGLGDAGEPSALVTDFLAQLSAFADEPPPEPSPELAALLGGATTPIDAAPSVRRRHWRRNLAVAAAAGAAAVSLTGVAAANESLPQPAQRVVSSVVNDLTPFHVNPSRLHPTPTPPAVAPAEREDHKEGPGVGSSSAPADDHSQQGGEDGGASQAGTGGGETEGGDGSAPGGGYESGSSGTDNHESPSSQPTGGEHHDSSGPTGGSEGGGSHD